MNYCIYKLTNSVNGKVYIGTTCQALKDRWRNGKAYKGTELGDDISEVGWSSFFKEVLVDGLSQGDAIQQEKKYIKLFNSFNDGYNSSVGGEVPTDKKIESMKLSLTGRKLSEKHKRRISESNKGKVFSNEHIENLRKSHIGQPGYWEGKQRDDSTKDKISKNLSIPIRCIQTEEIFKNAKEASEKTGFPASSIAKWCNGVTPKRTELRFERMK